MKAMKKILCLVMVLMMVLSLAACGGNTPAKAKVIEIDLTEEEYAFGVVKNDPELLTACNGYGDGVSVGRQTLHSFQQVVLGTGADVDEVVARQVQIAVFPAGDADAVAAFFHDLFQDCHVAVFAVEGQQPGEQMEDLIFFRVSHLISR